MKARNLGAPDYASIEDRRKTKVNSYTKDDRQDTQRSNSAAKMPREDRANAIKTKAAEQAAVDALRNMGYEASMKTQMAVWSARARAKNKKK